LGRSDPTIYPEGEVSLRPVVLDKAFKAHLVLGIQS